jgi:Asp-tRNA(Asn)/Glu-tRNA(Gln) amidotransferase A subunit family amidase
MSRPHALWTLDATQVLKLYENGTLTVVEYAQALIQRVQDRDDQVKAWAYFSMFFLQSWAV